MLYRHAIIPYTDRVYQEVVSWYRLRELEAPPTKPAMGLAYVAYSADGSPFIVAALAQYLSPIWLHLEYATSNPHLTKAHYRLLHHASCQLTEASVCCAASLGVKCTMLIYNKSFRHIARRCGFIQQPAGHWSRMPVVPVMFTQEGPAMPPPGGNPGTPERHPEQASD